MGKKLLAICMFFTCSFFACTNEQENAAEQDFVEFQKWANQQEQKVENSTEAEWAEIQREYDERVTKLDREVENINEESRKEYDKTKETFNTWADRNREYTRQQQDTTAMGMIDRSASEEWVNNLLGEYKDVKSITASNAAQAYNTFIKNVKASYKSWSDTDWEEANKVQLMLDERVDAFQGQLSQSDLAQINDIEIEYKALATKNR